MSEEEKEEFEDIKGVKKSVIRRTKRQTTIDIKLHRKLKI
jgi:hypothetical protein